MKCQEIEKILLEYQWGELTDAGVREVREHLLSCTRCSQYEEELRRFLNLLSGVEKKELSDSPYLFLKSRVEKLGRREHPRWAEKVLAVFRRPVPVYQAAFAALGLILLAWFGGSLTGSKEDRSRASLPLPSEASIKGSPQYPDTQISFVVTPTVWTRVHSVDTIPSRVKRY